MWQKGKNEKSESFGGQGRGVSLHPILNGVNLDLFKIYIGNGNCVACLNKMDIPKTNVHSMSAHVQQNSIIAIFDSI